MQSPQLAHPISKRDMRDAPVTSYEPSVDAVTKSLLAALDRHFPGQLESFYLVGSIALGDFHEGQSDLDFVAVLDGKVDLAILADIHAQIAKFHCGLNCDGIYLRPGELQAPPQGNGIEVRAGLVDPASLAERQPVTWLTLAEKGITLRGRPADREWIAADRDSAIAFSRENLQAYWRGWLEDRRRLVAPKGMSLLSGKAVVWGCLGVARLYALIARGLVVSKSGAGALALEHFPSSAPIVQEALRLRTNPGTQSHYASPLTRRRDLIAFMDIVIDAAG